MLENTTGSTESCCAAGAEATRGRAGKMGALSALFASACCGLPLLFIALGLGGLGFGAFLGAYHWYFTAAGVALLGAAWYVWLRERGRLRAAGSDVRNARATLGALAGATAIVVGFGALNAASALGWGDKNDAVRTASASVGSNDELARIVLPVEGMTCFTCEWAVEKALGKLPGVAEAKASTSEEKVLVHYEPGRVTVDELIAAVDSTGYKAGKPQS